MTIEWDFYDLHVKLETPLLGSQPANSDVWARFIATKAPDVEAEQAAEGTDFTIVEGDRPGFMVFYRDDLDRPILRSYQIKGALKEWANVTKAISKVPNLKHHIDVSLFVAPTTMVIGDHKLRTLERPLRAMTAQGPRVTVVASECYDPPAEWTWTVKLLPGSKVTLEALELACEYAAEWGIGQWRSGEYGKVTAEIKKRKAGK